MLDLGFVSAILAEKTFDEVADFAADQGFACVEMMCWPAGLGDARRYAGYVAKGPVVERILIHLDRQS